MDVAFSKVVTSVNLPLQRFRQSNLNRLPNFTYVGYLYIALEYVLELSLMLCT